MLSLNNQNQIRYLFRMISALYAFFPSEWLVLVTINSHTVKFK
jgi:hypothetical protein